MNKKQRLKKLYSTTVTEKSKPEKYEVFFTLDYDPIVAARSLIINHVKSHARIISTSFMFAYSQSNIQDIQYSNKTRLIKRPRPFIYETPYNVWFYSVMYEELCKIYKAYSGEEMIEPDGFYKENMLYKYDTCKRPKDDSNILVQPNYLSKILKDYKFKKYKILGIIDNPSNSIIDIQRLMYVVDGYSLELFPCGAPSWYSPMCREIYRKYDRISKKTFIIETDSQGKYRYYYQYISDRPKEILDINEIRDLIDSLIFNR